MFSNKISNMNTQSTAKPNSFSYFTCEVPVFLFFSELFSAEVGGLTCKKMMLHNSETEI